MPNRPRDDKPTDLWHKTKLGAGEHPCPGGGPCRGAGTAPTSKHGQGDRWAATWDIYQNGRRKQHSRRFKRYEVAAAFQRKMREQIDERGLPLPLVQRKDTINVRGWFAEFMEKTLCSRSAATNHKLECQFRLYVAGDGRADADRYLGDWDLMPLQHQPDAIQAWQLHLEQHGKQDGRPLGRDTVQEVVKLLACMFDWAVDYSDMTGMWKNPARSKRATPPAAGRAATPALRKREWNAEKVRAAYYAPRSDDEFIADQRTWERYRLMALLAATSGGMRISEVSCLDIDDIDWLRQEIRITATLAGTNGKKAVNVGIHYHDGKSTAALRTVTVAGTIMAALERYVATVPQVPVRLPFEAINEHGRYDPPEMWPTLTRRLIFTTPSRRPIYSQSFNSVLMTALGRAHLLPAKPRPITGRYGPVGALRDPSPSDRWESPREYGLNFQSLRAYYISLMQAEPRTVSDATLKYEVGHTRRGALYGQASMRDITHDVYAHPRPEEKPAIRAIIEETFGPLFPEYRTLWRRDA
jgi:integrase